VARPASRLACGYRSRVATTSLDQRIDLRELRRVINVVADRTVRSRLLAQLDALRRIIHTDVVAEIAASTELGVIREHLEAETLRADTAERERAEAVLALGDARRALAAAREQLRVLRELATDDLADQLVETAARFELLQPTAPPLVTLRRAANLTRAVRNTRSTR
jgi:DNA topoisomerase VI subunit B